MPNYSVKVVAQHTVLITARDEAEARRLAQESVRRVSRDASVIFSEGTFQLGAPGASPVQLELDRQMKAGAIRGPTRTCMRCDHVALAEDFGPGFITCPGCKRQQPTVAEQREIELERLKVTRPDRQVLITNLADPPSPLSALDEAVLTAQAAKKLKEHAEAQSSEGEFVTRFLLSGQLLEPHPLGAPWHRHWIG